MWPDDLGMTWIERVLYDHDTGDLGLPEIWDEPFYNKKNYLLKVTDRIYKEYLTKSYWRQIVEACRYTFENLDWVIDDEGFDRYDNYYFLVDEKFTLLRNSTMINYMHIEIKKLDHGSQLTINAHYPWTFGPFMKNQAVKLGKEFIRTVKLAEFSNFTPELAKYNSEPVVNNASESSNSIPKHDDQNKHEPSLDDKV